MNIQLLLSANPSQGSGASASQATGAQGLSNGVFRQAMLQANESQPRGLNELPTATVNKDALSEFASLLDALGIELNQGALAELFAQLQMAEQSSPEQLAALPAVTGASLNMPLSELEETSYRLSLVPPFSDDTSLTGPSTSKTTPISTIAEQLSINQQDAIAPINAYQQFTGNNGATTRIETLSQEDVVALINAYQQVTAGNSNAQRIEMLSQQDMVALIDAYQQVTAGNSNAQRIETLSQQDMVALIDAYQQVTAGNGNAQRIETLSQEDVVALIDAYQQVTAGNGNAQRIETLSQEDMVALIDAYQQVTAGNGDAQRIETLSPQIALSLRGNVTNTDVNTQQASEQLEALPTPIGTPFNMPLSALEEISNRLSLVAAFANDTTLSGSSTSDTTSIATISEQLSISQKDAAVLINAYQQVAGGNGTAQRTDTLSQQIAALSMGNATNTETNIPSTTVNMLSVSALPTATTQLTSLSGEAVASALAVSSSAGESATRMAGSGETAFSFPSASLQPTTAATGASLPSAIGTPVSHPAWPSQLRQQLVQFAQKGGEQHIQMKLHPAELGPLSISLKVTEHGAQAHFLSAHAQVRQVIEQAIPQLREALAEQGIALGDTSVGEQNASNEQAFAQQNASPGAAGEGSGIDSEAGAHAKESAPVTLDGRVDLYA
ncbi:flagellar hook-length control protein FliK [Halomonas sp. DWK9]|uniref:flagellar hook-length control protein FliK n=1 Tax=Halomonas sp. DWK9 TaxID=3060155 RepID=UPI00287FD282|nr:flagellar hook-length control protein FliK [Halomonas sp. DWK9]